MLKNSKLDIHKFSIRFKISIVLNFMKSFNILNLYIDLLIFLKYC